MRVEILSLTFEPSSHVALDKSVQRVYVEYRLLGVPMETTETPMSLRKPTKGEEIHYNFTRGAKWLSFEIVPNKAVSKPQGFVSSSDLCRWLPLGSTQTVSSHHAGGQWPQPRQVGPSYNHIISEELLECKFKLHVFVFQRLKFTVVSEPMDDEDECVDVGNAYLDLQELLLTGNDVIEQRIDSRCCT